MSCKNISKTAKYYIQKWSPICPTFWHSVSIVPVLRAEQKFDLEQSAFHSPSIACAQWLLDVVPRHNTVKTQENFIVDESNWIGDSDLAANGNTVCLTCLYHQHRTQTATEYYSTQKTNICLEHKNYLFNELANPAWLGGVFNTVEHWSKFSQPVAIDCCNALHVFLQ